MVSVGMVTVLFAHYSRFVRAPFIAHVSYPRMFIHSQNSGSRNCAPRRHSAIRTRRRLIACGH